MESRRRREYWCNMPKLHVNGNGNGSTPWSDRHVSDFIGKPGSANQVPQSTVEARAIKYHSLPLPSCCTFTSSSISSTLSLQVTNLSALSTKSILISGLYKLYQWGLVGRFSFQLENISKTRIVSCCIFPTTRLLHSL